MNKIEKMEKQLENIKKLSFIEAQNLYKQILEMDDEDQKKQAMNQLILGTLYVVPKIVKKDTLSLSETGSYDVDDIIESTYELWIKRIYDGALLSANGFSNVLPRGASLAETVVGKQDKNYVLGEFPNSSLVKLFDSYIKFRKKGQKISFKELCFDCEVPYYDASYENFTGFPLKPLYDSYTEAFMLSVFEGAYDDLVASHEDDFDVSFIKKDEISNHANLIYDAGMCDYFDESMIIEDMESDIIKEQMRNCFIDDVKEILDEELYNLIASRFGLEGRECLSIQDARKLFNYPNNQKVRLLESRALSKLKSSNRIGQYHKGKF